MAPDARFDYNKDPVGWFYQNQIRSEEEFQANKERVRTEARERLHELFDKKGKRLVVDSDEDDFSVHSSELSAWDSDVVSVASMASAAESWAASSKFTAPAGSTLQYILIVAVVSDLEDSPTLSAI
jgi:hypothetical protein